MPRGFSQGSPQNQSVPRCGTLCQMCATALYAARSSEESRARRVEAGTVTSDAELVAHVDGPGARLGASTGPGGGGGRGAREAEEHRATRARHLARGGVDPSRRLGVDALGAHSPCARRRPRRRQRARSARCPRTHRSTRSVGSRGSRASSRCGTIPTGSWSTTSKDCARPGQGPDRAPVPAARRRGGQGDPYRVPAVGRDRRAARLRAPGVHRPHDHVARAPPRGARPHP